MKDSVAESEPIKAFFTPDEVPTLEECQQNIRERAFQLWKDAGEPETEGQEYWYQAEQELYGGLTQGGYRVYIGEKDNPTADTKIVTVNGIEDFCVEKLDAVKAS